MTIHAPRTAADLLRRSFRALAALGIAGVLGCAPSASRDSAERLCRIFGSMAVVTTCDVTLDRTVDVTIDTNSEGARALCDSVSASLPNKGILVDPAWKLRVLSPYSGDKPIAICGLRSG